MKNEKERYQLLQRKKKNLKGQREYEEMRKKKGYKKKR